jgi:hypothetical protein
MIIGNRGGEAHRVSSALRVCTLLRQRESISAFPS